MKRSNEIFISNDNMIVYTGKVVVGDNSIFKILTDKDLFVDEFIDVFMNLLDNASPAEFSRNKNVIVCYGDIDSPNKVIFRRYQVEGKEGKKVNDYNRIKDFLVVRSALVYSSIDNIFHLYLNS